MSLRRTLGPLRHLGSCGRRAAAGLLFGLFFSLWAASAAQAAYPDRPVTIVVPFAADSAADANVRVLADKLKSTLGAPVVVDNKPGANGLIGTKAVVGAAADGYTLLYHSTSIVISPWLVKGAPDPTKTLVPLVQVASTPYLIAVRPALGIRTLAEFIAYAKSHPNGLACSTYGVGSPPHIALELLKQSAGIDVLHVPYRAGFAGALVDLESGQLQCAVDLPANVMPHAARGALVAVAATAPSTLPSLKGVPVLSNEFPAAAVVGWSGLFAPLGTPPEVLQRLEAALKQAIADPTVLSSLQNVGMSPTPAAPPAEFAGQVQTDLTRFGEIIRRNGITAQ